MLVLFPNLLTLRIVMILSKIKTIYAVHGCQNKRVSQCPCGRIEPSLDEQWPTTLRRNVDTELKRGGVILVLNPDNVTFNPLRIVIQD